MEEDYDQCTCGSMPAASVDQTLQFSSDTVATLYHNSLRSLKYLESDTFFYKNFLFQDGRVWPGVSVAQTKGKAGWAAEKCGAVWLGGGGAAGCGAQLRH